jgi:8-oxo-dGTP pyrophosphatase MutT (NUDIX family)
MGKRFVSWDTLLKEEVFSNPWMSIYHNIFELPSGKKGNYFYMHTNGSAMTVPVTGDGKIVLVKQYRYLTDNVSIELPCGGIKEGQDYTDAARAELTEETGYDCKSLKNVGRFVPYNGLSDEFCVVFIAKALFEVGKKPDETEQIEVFTAAPAEINTWIKKGKILDGMTIAGWAIAERFVR